MDVKRVYPLDIKTVCNKVLKRKERCLKLNREVKIDIEIPYGKGSKKVSIPDKNLQNVVHPNEVKIKPPGEILKDALDNPVGTESFDEFIGRGEDILFIVNDGTRPTPTALILELLSKRMDLKKARYIVATGAHRAPNEEEFNFIFGDLYEELKERIIIHDARKEEEMVHIGTTSNGTEMWVNENAYNAGCLIPIGSVEPHYFGGFTGGRKSFLPGVAGYKTIEQNHKMALKPGAKALKLKGNPVHEDFNEAIKKISEKPMFSIQTVLDGERNLYAATSGDIYKSFDRAIKYAMEVFCVSIDEKADIVISVAPYPMDVDLYQSQKAIDNAKLALKDDGILIMVSSCRMGLGSSVFYDLLSSSDSPEEVIEMIKKKYKLGYHKAGKMAEIAMWAEMWGVSELDDEILENSFIKPFNTVQDAADAALKKKGEDANILIMMDGSITVPVTGESSV